MDACFRSTGAFHALEIDGEVVDDSKEAATEEESESHCEDDIAVFEQSWGKGALVAELELRDDEDDGEEAETDK